MITRTIGFRMAGHPRPKGSLKCIPLGNQHRMVEDNKKTGPWRKALALAMKTHLPDRAALHQPIGVEVTFTVERPQSHFGTGRNAGVVKDSAPTFPTTKPAAGYSGGDVDKLLRLLLDAMQDAGVLVDDAQVVEVVARKAYVNCPVVPDALEFPGVRVRAYPYEGD